MPNKDEFLDAIKMQLSYWHTLPNLSIYQRLRGLIFSVLVEIDGEGTTPGYEMRILREDKEPGKDIAGDLHELWSRSMPSA